MSITVSPLTAPLIDAGVAILHSGLTKVKTAVDGMISGTETQVQPLVDKEVPAVEDWLEAKSGAKAKGLLSGIFGLGGGLISSQATLLEEGVAASLVHLQGEVDVDLDRLSAHLDSATAVADK